MIMLEEEGAMEEVSFTTSLHNNEFSESIVKKEDLIEGI